MRRFDTVCFPIICCVTENHMVAKRFTYTFLCIPTYQAGMKTSQKLKSGSAKRLLACEVFSSFRDWGVFIRISICNLFSIRLISSGLVQLQWIQLREIWYNITAKWMKLKNVHLDEHKVYGRTFTKREHINLLQHCSGWYNDKNTNSFSLSGWPGRI